LMIILYAFLTIVISREMERNTYVVFNNLMQIEMNKRHQAGELKHFIGNVAHDLKVTT
jgi:hypothetical protein